MALVNHYGVDSVCSKFKNGSKNNVAVSPVLRMSELAPIQISLLIKHNSVAALRLRWTALPQPVSWAMMNLLMRVTAGPGALPLEMIGQQYAVKGSI